jgi:hypothetical protein
VLAGVEARAPGSCRAETLPPPEDLTFHPQLLLRVRSVELEELTLDALVSPAVLTSGWPSCFAEFLPVVPRLTDPAAHRIGGPGFDVVILSLPGYGFSGRPARTGVTSRYTAGLWHRLMRGLGYRRYGAPDASRTGRPAGREGGSERPAPAGCGSDRGLSGGFLLRWLKPRIGVRKQGQDFAHGAFPPGGFW